MSEAPAYCSRCGARIAPEASFCVECGAAIAAAGPPVAPPFVPPSDAAAVKPPGGFPWGVCAVIVGAVVVLLMLTAVVLVGWFVFRHPPTSVPSDHMQELMEQSEPPGAAPGSPQAAAISADEAIARVKARPEISVLLQTGAASGAMPRVELDREYDDSYVVHAYTELAQAPKGVPATIDFGWYKVSKATGEVTLVPGP